MKSSFVLRASLVLLLAVFSLTLLSLSSAEEKLDGKRIAPLLPELLQLHVQQHDMDPEFLRRLLAQFVEQIDPSREFYLKSEAEALTSLDEPKLRALAAQIKKGDLSHFEEALKGFLKTQFERDKQFYAGLAGQEDEIKRLAKDPENLRKVAAINPPPKDVPLQTTDPKAQNQPAESIKWTEFPASEEERQQRVLRQTAGLFAFNKHYLADADAIKQALGTQKQERDKWQNVQLRTKSAALFLKAFMQALDPHSSYMDEDDQDEFNSNIQRNFAGIGVQIRPHPLGAQIADVIKGGPADKLGKFAPGDQIVAVDGSALAGLPINRIVKLIKGEKGTDVKLTLLKRETQQTEVVLVKRDTIELADVRVKAKVHNTPKGRVAVVNVQTFYDGVHKDVQNRIAELQREGALAGVVLDLRYNTGGLLEEALGLAGLFVKSGKLVCERDGEGTEIWHDDPSNGLIYSGPLVVLTNQFSASASEIVAGTLQQYGRGIIAAQTQTFGKGTVQRLLPLRDLRLPGQMTLTIAQYFLADGSSVQVKGVEPEVVVPGPKLAEEEGLLERATKNALPFAKIAGKLDLQAAEVKLWREWKQKHVPVLQEKSKARVAANPEFEKEFNEKKTAELSPEIGPDPSLKDKEKDLQADEVVAIVADMVESWPLLESPAK